MRNGNYSDKKVFSIFCFGSQYTVGIDGVTEIKEAYKNGDMAAIIYYEIWKGDNLYGDLHSFDFVLYESPTLLNQEVEKK